MFKSAQLDDIIETSCSQCNARYRITDEQLKIAVGKVRCGECGEIFNALTSLKAYVDNDHDHEANRQQPSVSPNKTHTSHSQLSLHEAMYGEGKGSFTHFYPLLWLLGILLLLVLALTQAIYYQRYELISNSRYQQQILHLCELVPCGNAKFSNSRQIKLLERNVFTHPVRPNALMMTGSFVNEAPFPQKLPKLLVTLFDIQGNLIANRQFVSGEYLQPGNQPTELQINQPIQFRLEILDSGTVALTYEFEFL
ncbi:MAG: putative Zn finger-like uncharacterized protein [Gammaproteobacteria bacterium]|jgi:predicted Zn finger-like uncharacterized protein